MLLGRCGGTIGEVPFVMTPSRFHCAAPIMGPPLTTLSGWRTRPPQKSITSRTGVPMGTMTFCGFAMQSPSMVTVRSVSAAP